ncbi:hypothetical protein CVT25_002002 [Psilocybe cyanescens]|uniref:Uncharacterized protein n=1 Tax=Psilocybe cyanescens TaxID=93625 RepID=A0A409WD71_PSICY|nr:hypothetical protein CVT25_002002 [Psilocybe cyanescens]
MTMIVESAAAYALVLLLYAIDTVAPSVGVLGSPLNEADYYIATIVNVVAGMAPTILVARVAANDNQTVSSSTMTHISGLKFGSQQESGNGHSGNSTGGEINGSVHRDDAEPTPVVEVKREPNTDATSGDNQV